MTLRCVSPPEHTPDISSTFGACSETEALLFKGFLLVRYLENGKQNGIRVWLFSVSPSLRKSFKRQQGDALPLRAEFSPFPGNRGADHPLTPSPQLF